MLLMRVQVINWTTIPWSPTTLQSRGYVLVHYFFNVCYAFLGFLQDEDDDYEPDDARKKKKGKKRKTRSEEKKGKKKKKKKKNDSGDVSGINS